MTTVIQFYKSKAMFNSGYFKYVPGKTGLWSKESRDHWQKLCGLAKTWESWKLFFKVLMTWKDDGIKEPFWRALISHHTLTILWTLSWHYRHRKLSLSCCFLYNLHSSLSLCTNDWNKISLIIRLWLFIIA